MTTIELIAPTGQTLTASLFPIGNDTPDVSDIALTESTNAKGVYRGSFTTGPTGAHRVVVFDGTTPLVVTGVRLTGVDGVAFCSDIATESISAEVDLSPIAALLADIQDRIAAQVASGPVVVVPAPGEDQTTAWCLCYGPDGTPAASVGVEVWIEGATKGGHGRFSSDRRTVTSDENGLLAFPIPRNPLLRFAIQSGADGAKITFQGVDADSLKLPTIIG